MFGCLRCLSFTRGFSTKTRRFHVSDRTVVSLITSTLVGTSAFSFHSIALLHTHLLTRCVLDNQFWQDQTLKKKTTLILQLQSWCSNDARSLRKRLKLEQNPSNSDAVYLNSRGEHGTKSWSHECKAEYLQDVQLLSSSEPKRGRFSLSTMQNVETNLTEKSLQHFVSGATNKHFLRDTWRRTRGWVISSVNSYRKFRYTVDTILRLYFLTDIHSTIYFILHSTAILFYKSEKDYIKKTL